MMGLTAVTAVAAAPKYIFYFIGDGMGPGQVMAAETYNRMTRGSDTELLMMRLPVNAMCTTWSASSPVTDSAAAGTALAAGVKTKNSMLGMGPDSVAVNSIAVDLKEMGYGIGLITNVAPDDATPGAFYAHVPYRGMYYEIGCQAAESGVDFLPVRTSGARVTVTAFIMVCMSGLLPTEWMWCAVLTAHAEACRAKCCCWIRTL